MTWEIFLGIVAIVGFITAVATPIVKLISAITGLRNAVEQLNIQLMKNEKKLDTYGDKIDALIKDNIRLNDRITVLEKTIFKKGEQS